MKAFCIRDKKSGLFWSHGDFRSKTCVPTMYTKRVNAEQMAFGKGSLAHMIRLANDPKSHVYGRGWWDWEPEIVEAEIIFK
jgi:hypothetical protein